ncbi:MAG: hypothetical protein ACP5SB_02935 [Caldisericaceae bacterium]
MKKRIKVAVILFIIFLLSFNPLGNSISALSTGKSESSFKEAFDSKM